MSPPLKKISWTAEAEEMIKLVPFFVRSTVKKKIEAAARAQDREEVTKELLEDLKKKLMAGA